MTIPIVTQSGMTIVSVTVTGLAGSQTLILHGRRFGTVRGEKIVSLNLNGRRYSAEVSRWMDNEVRVPANLPAGEYRVLVYYDASREVSSNSQPVRLGRVDPPVVRRQPPPPARGVHRRSAG
jgi:hypothetical protein